MSFLLELPDYFFLGSTNKQHTCSSVLYCLFGDFLLHDPPDKSVLPHETEILLNKIRHVYNSYLLCHLLFV